MLIAAKFWGTIDNFYKFSETYVCEVAYQLWRLYHSLFKLTAGEKEEFSIPHEFDVKAINLDQNNKLGLFYASFSIEIMTQFVDYID